MQKEIIFFDLETTGVNVNQCKIVEIAIIREDDSFFHEIINPECFIPVEASNIHGITNEMVTDKKTFKQLANEIFAIVDPSKTIWAGYNNQNFDCKLLINEFKRVGITINIDEVEILDVYKIWVNLSQRKLKDAYLHFCGKELINAHSAVADIQATKEIFIAQKDYYNESDLLSLSKNFKADYSSNTNNVKFIQTEDSVTLNFGKYKGVTVKHLLKNDVGYLRWIISADNFTIEEKNIIQKEAKRLKDSTND